MSTSSRRRRQATHRRHPRQASQSRDPVVGWYARRGIVSLCDGDALIIAGSKERIRQIAARMHQVARRIPAEWDFIPTSFSEILRGIRLRAAYAFDEQAYRVFLPLGRAAGLNLKEEDFSDPGPLGMHFVRIQLVPLLPSSGWL